MSFCKCKFNLIKSVVCNLASYAIWQISLTARLFQLSKTTIKIINNLEN